MKPYAKYSFTKRDRLVHYFTECVFEKHIGVSIPNFAPEWISIHKTHSHSGLIHGAFNKMSGVSQFAYAVSLEGTAYIGLNHISELPNFYYGYFGSDAVLFKREMHKWAGMKGLTLWFFKDMKDELATLHHLCISGQLELV